MPHKRRSIDADDRVAQTIDLRAGDFTLREIAPL